MAKDVAWSPQPGPQADAISADWCAEIMYGGALFGGKSDFLLGDFLKDVPKYERHWQGILFRKSMPELEFLIQRSREFYPKTGAEWKEGKKQWQWPNGAMLRMRYLEKVSDVQKYMGPAYTWEGWDQLEQWPTGEAYHLMKSRLRWAEADVPTKRIRSTANPGGIGHGWIKEYFIDRAPLGWDPYDDPESKMTRMYIPSRAQDNKIGLTRDPAYLDRVKGIGSPEMVKAWLEGDWNVIAGSYFPEFGDVHIVVPFVVPEHWMKFRSFDWGSAKPFSVGWWAVSDGDVEGIPRNALVRYREWYGAKSPNVGLKMNAKDVGRGIASRSGEKTLYTVVDPSIFKHDGGPSIAEQLYEWGVKNLKRADNSRIAGWEQLRMRLIGEEGCPMMYFFDTCVDSIRTLPTLPHDPKRAEELDTRSEDHAADEIRYACMSRPYIPREHQDIRKRISHARARDDNSIALYDDFDPTKIFRVSTRI